MSGLRSTSRRFPWRAHLGGPFAFARIAALGAVAMMIAACSDGRESSHPPTTVGAGQITPLLEATLSMPRWFTGSDGVAHLVYELLLTNAVPAAVTLNAVDVQDADSGTTLGRLSGEALREATSLATSPDAPTVVVPPS